MGRIRGRIWRRPERRGRYRTIQDAPELADSVASVNARSALKDLDDGALALDFQHLAGAHGAVRQAQVDNLVQGRKRKKEEKDER